MRTLGTALATHVAGDAHTLCAMLRIDLKDGTQLAFTDHDEPLTFDLGDGALAYQPDTGILPSDLSLSAGFTADDMEVSGPIGDVVTRTAVLGGRYDDATVRYFFVNWSDLSQGAAKLLKGYVALASVEGGTFKFTVHSEIAKFARSVGRVITGYCDADLGDARCGFALTADTETVTAVTDARTFQTTNGSTRANDYFNQGTVVFTTGALAGCRPVEVFDWSLAGDVSLWTDLPEPPAIGDTLELRRGCDKTRAMCRDTFDNVINFRGFPDVPGSDQVLRYPNPGG